MSNEIQTLLNDQITCELYSAYLYLDFSLYFEEEGLPGFSHWYRVQAGEEQQHALRIIRFLQDTGAHITLSPIGKPDADFMDLMTVIRMAQEHEKYVTGQILRLCRAADGAADYTTLRFLDWFVNEQREEEKNAAAMCSRAARYTESEAGLYLLDRELAKRGEE